MFLSMNSILPSREKSQEENGYTMSLQRTSLERVLNVEERKAIKENRISN